MTIQSLREEYDAVLITIGASTDKKLGIEGEHSEGVLSAVQFLRDVGKNQNPDLTGQEVAVIGGDIKEYQILLDPARMKHYGVGLDQVLLVCRQMNQNANGGVLYEYSNEYIIRGVLTTTKAEELAKGVVAMTPAVNHRSWGWLPNGLNRQFWSQ